MQQSLKRFGFPVMGTYCEIQIYDDSRVNAKNRVRRLSSELLRLEQKYSGARRDSLTTEINYSAGNKLGIKMDKETLALFEQARKLYQDSDGLMDITSGILRRIWDFRKTGVPSQAQIDKLLPRVGFDKLTWRGARLLLPSGMEIDFAPFLKEYAADQAANLGRELGIEHGLINLGGTFAVIGAQPEQEAWTVGIANPQQRDTMLARIDLVAGGLATSGDYEWSFVHEGRRYSPVLNPVTGYAGTGLRAVSVAADDCMAAVTAATMAMLKPETEAIALLQSAQHDHVYMSGDGEVAGKGLKPSEALGTKPAPAALHPER